MGVCFVEGKRATTKLEMKNAPVVPAHSFNGKIITMCVHDVDVGDDARCRKIQPQHTHSKITKKAVVTLQHYSRQFNSKHCIAMQLNPIQSNFSTCRPIHVQVHNRTLIHFHSYSFSLLLLDSLLLPMITFVVVVFFRMNFQHFIHLCASALLK